MPDILWNHERRLSIGMDRYDLDIAAGGSSY